jgi:hypothetical protein
MVPCGKYPERSSAFDELFFKKKVLSYLRLASVSYHRALACLSTDDIILFMKHCTVIFLLLGSQSPTMVLWHHYNGSFTSSISYSLHCGPLHVVLVLIRQITSTRRQPDQVERGRVSGRDMLGENELVEQ